MKYDFQYRHSKQSYDPSYGNVVVATDGGYESGYEAGYGKGEAEGYSKGQTEGYEAGHTAGYTEGETAAYAAAEAHNAAILTDCNAVLPTKGASTADTLEQVPQRIGEIVQEEDMLRYSHAPKLLGLGVFDKEEVVLQLDNTLTLNRFLYNDGLASPYSYGNAKVKHLVLNCKYQIVSTQQMTLTGDYILERITLNADISKAASAMNMFANLYALKVVDGTPLDLSSSTNNGNMLSNSTKVEEIRFAPNTIKSSIGLQGSGVLSDATIQSVIDGLAEVATAQTLTLHSSVNEKLTDAQCEAIFAKNWSI